MVYVWCPAGISEQVSQMSGVQMPHPMMSRHLLISCIPMKFPLTVAIFRSADVYFWCPIATNELVSKMSGV